MQGKFGRRWNFEPLSNDTYVELTNNHHSISSHSMPMSNLFEVDYLSAGGNRHSAAADWSRTLDIVAYGADQNIALWAPNNQDQKGIFALLRGHNAKVNAVRFLESFRGDGIDGRILVSGDADGELLVQQSLEDGESWARLCKVKAHDGAVNCITSLEGGNLIVTGGADSHVKLWWYDGNDLTLLAAIVTKPRFIPLSLEIGKLDADSPAGGAFIAAAGTRNDVYVYAMRMTASETTVTLCATLTGHEGWIRSLALRKQDDRGYLLASASADKYVRLWRFTPESRTLKQATNGAGVTGAQSTLTAKVQKVSVDNSSYAITFEALLLGHEDWVYSTSWHPDPGIQQLLTASADGTLTIWEPDTSSGVWTSTTRLGEISGQKGATTATGSSGGFWNALWSPDGRALTCLGRTGSWRLWRYDETLQYWVQRPGVGGHVSSVTGISWSPDGTYLLTTSSDQTTRLHAEWKRGTKRTWHEFARPQIHGYGLNCVTCVSNDQFSSGADEKLLRVFDKPKAIANMLERLCGAEASINQSLPEIAAVAVLGLSNKAVEEDTEAQNGSYPDTDGEAVAKGAGSELANLSEPPTEDLLARHTLWPEHEKLYGHGYEISEAATGDGILATACKASSLDHAVIRLYDLSSWQEVKPPLSAHTLTVTRLTFFPGPEQYLLSVGRDRQWSVFHRDADIKSWQIGQSFPKAHSRMILDAAWAPGSDPLIFATAGRDKTVKLWVSANSSSLAFHNTETFSCKSAVTAIDFFPTQRDDTTVLAVGEDDGSLSIHAVCKSRSPMSSKIGGLDASRSPSKTITRLAWKPTRSYGDGDLVKAYLAVTSADSSVRILRKTIEEMTPANEAYSVP